MFKFLIFVLFVGVVRASFNKIVDEALKIANYEIAKKGLSKIDLPDLKYGINDKIGFIDIDVGLSLNRGWVKNVSTIQRKGDVKFPLGNDSTILFDAVLGLGELEVHFDDFVTDLLLIKLHHNVSVTVKNNAVSFELAVVATGNNCSTQVNRFKITQFSGIEVYFYPKTILHKLKDIVTTAVANIAAPILERIINPRLKPIFNDILDKINICGLIPIPKI